MTNAAASDSKIRTATAAEIERAADLLAGGGLVAFPTETVYGLAASALDPSAIARIFAAKGRAADKPLIMFVSDLKIAKKVAVFTPLALKIAEKFWPGALTLVLKRPEGCPLPGILTAGGDTIAIRIPQNPVALALLNAARLPLAVTSANRSGDASPTSAEGVARGMADALDLILDGGPSALGQESTVLDVSVETPTILRAGATSRKELEEFLGVPLEGAGR